MLDGVVHCSSATKTGQTVDETALRSSGKSSAEIVEEAIHSALAALRDGVARRNSKDAGCVWERVMEGP